MKYGVTALSRSMRYHDGPICFAHSILARRSYYGREKLLSFILDVLEGALTPLGQKRESAGDRNGARMENTILLKRSRRLDCHVSRSGSQSARGVVASPLTGEEQKVIIVPFRVRRRPASERGSPICPLQWPCDFCGFSCRYAFCRERHGIRARPVVRSGASTNPLPPYFAIFSP